MPPRQRSIPTDFQSRLARSLAAEGRIARGGMSRIGPHRRGGSGNQSVLANVGNPADQAETAGAAQLLVLSATADPIASGGDHVDLSTVLDQQGGFLNVVQPSGGAWVHPITATYVLTYEHAWDSFEEGGDVDLELDGITTLARRIGTRTDWQRGRGTIHYYAEAGQVGRIKVTHSDASAQICDAAMWLSVPDPLATIVGHSAELYIDDALVAWTDAPLTANHTGAATLLIGELSASNPEASVFVYDDVSVASGASNLLGNGGFESAVAGTGTSSVVTTGNWRLYDFGASTPAIVSSPVHGGSQAFRVDGAAGSPALAYCFQDFTLAEGDAFELEFAVRPSSGQQSVVLGFDYNRSSSFAQSVELILSTTTVAATVLGESLLAAVGLTAGQWSIVRLVVPAQEVA